MSTPMVDDTPELSRSRRFFRSKGPWIAALAFLAISVTAIGQFFQLREREERLAQIDTYYRTRLATIGGHLKRANETFASFKGYIDNLADDPNNGYSSEEGETASGIVASLGEAYSGIGRLVDGTPAPSSLASVYAAYDRSPSIRFGARCSDGTLSEATGRGACSHHGGVSLWLSRKLATLPDPSGTDVFLSIPSSSGLTELRAKHFQQAQAQADAVSAAEASRDTQARQDYFTVGSSEGEVIALMGTPTGRRSLGNWTYLSYGLSSVTLVDGKVSGYANYDHNLKVRE